MKISTGTDIVEIARIKKAIETKKEKFISKIYTRAEISYCEARDISKYESYAVRFAAKEAVYKAINNIDSKISWLDVQVLNDENGKPKIRFLKKGYEQIHSIDISLSHSKEYAVASVVVLYE